MDYTISRHEYDREEWKEVCNDTLIEEALKTLCGFLNTFGGKIIFGVDANGNAKPLTDDLDMVQRKIFDKAKAHIKPNAFQHFNFTVYDNLLYIFVRADSKNIYQYRSVIYKRTGSSTHSLTFEAAKKLEEQRKDHTREVAPNIFVRSTNGEVCRCTKCGHIIVSGMTNIISVGGPMGKRPCPQPGCDGEMISD